MTSPSKHMKNYLAGVKAMESAYAGNYEEEGDSIADELDSIWDKLTDDERTSLRGHTSEEIKEITDA